MNVNKPVAWRWRHRGSFDWKVTNIPPDQWDAPTVLFDWEPLYAAAPTSAPVPVDPAELEALRRDAARYRAVRDYPWLKIQRDTLMHLSANAFDGVVDAALAANGEKGT